jgi:hypothetical protein
VNGGEIVSTFSLSYLKHVLKYGLEKTYTLKRFRITARG